MISSLLLYALSKYPKPEILNTDQGSRAVKQTHTCKYTAKEHIDILVKNSKYFKYYFNLILLNISLLAL